MKIKRALITVFDKDGLLEVARALNDYDIEIVSTGGTMKALKDAGMKVTSVSDITGFPEILDGRVKTLHPKIHGGILAKRAKADHMTQIEEHDIKPFELVIVNLYPFEKATANPTAVEDIALENIDIGGPTLIRAAAKNYHDTTVLTHPSDYSLFMAELRLGDGEVSLEFRHKMAAAAFSRTASYDSAISAYFKRGTEAFPTLLNLSYRLHSILRYGENPHQKAGLYQRPYYGYASIANGKLLSGKELSFNNIWDLEAGLQMAADFRDPFAAVIKHTNPCGAAVGQTLAEAYEKALAADPVSAFGSVIALNRAVDIDTAKLLHETAFVECILAPSFDKESIELLSKKKNRRLLEVGQLTRPPESEFDFRPIAGGILAQTPDRREIRKEDLEFITRKTPDDDQIDELLFAYKIVKHIKSNAIVICKDKTTIGVGPGQTSRVESSMIAVRKAGNRAKGAVAASDAFFPMPDGLEVLVDAGVKAVIQPGGSKADPDLIETANRRGIVMVFTGIRHFKH